LQYQIHIKQKEYKSYGVRAKENNFSQLSKSVFHQKIKGKHFPENQAKFFFDWKVFSID